MSRVRGFSKADAQGGETITLEKERKKLFSFMILIHTYFLPFLRPSYTSTLGESETLDFSFNPHLSCLENPSGQLPLHGNSLKVHLSKMQRCK